MNDQAWAGWASVKILADSLIRENMETAPELLNYLKNRLAFDGQKGRKMRFRQSGQLDQPLLITEGDKVLSETPIRGVSHPKNVKSLGLIHCTSK